MAGEDDYQAPRRTPKRSDIGQSPLNWDADEDSAMSERRAPQRRARTVMPPDPTPIRFSSPPAAPQAPPSRQPQPTFDDEEYLPEPGIDFDALDFSAMDTPDTDYEMPQFGGVDMTDDMFSEARSAEQRISGLRGRQPQAAQPNQANQLSPETSPGTQAFEEMNRSESRARLFEAMLKVNQKPLRVEEDPKPTPQTSRPRQREFLFRGGVYTFHAIGPRSEGERRAGVVERWQTDIHLNELGVNVIVFEYVDGRFTPWAFEGIFFNDFLQAATVGIVSGGFQAQWHHEVQLHEKTRKKLAFLLPAGIVLGVMVGIVIGLR